MEARFGLGGVFDSPFQTDHPHGARDTGAAGEVVPQAEMWDGEWRDARGINTTTGGGGGGGGTARSVTARDGRETSSCTEARAAATTLSELLCPDTGYKNNNNIDNHNTAPRTRGSARELTASGGEPTSAVSSRCCCSSSTDKTTTTATTTISETARELCKAVSVSLGLAIDPQAHHEGNRSADFFEVRRRKEEEEERVHAQSDDRNIRTSSSSAGAGAGGAAAGREGRAPHVHGDNNKLLEMFKSSDEEDMMMMMQMDNARAHHQTGVITENSEFGPGVASLMRAKSASAAAGSSSSSSSCQFQQQHQQHDPQVNFELAPSVHDRYGDDYYYYWPRYNNVRVKYEAVPPPVTRYGHGAAQYGNPACTGSSAGLDPPLICSPYEYDYGARSGPGPSISAAHEPWYNQSGAVLPRVSYPTATCMKNEVGEWLDVSTMQDCR